MGGLSSHRMCQVFLLLARPETASSPCQVHVSICSAEGSLSDSNTYNFLNLEFPSSGMFLYCFLFSATISLRCVVETSHETR